jgi:hypothetical protein
MWEGGDMLLYIVAWDAFLYESYVECDSVRKCRRTFPGNFPWSQFQAQQAFINLLRNSDILSHLIKADLLGHFWTRDTRKGRVLAEEKLDEIGTWLKHATEITETPRTRVRLLEIVSSHSHETALNGEESVCRAGRALSASLTMSNLLFP